MSVTIYHNPRCTKSRLTLELLEKKGIKPEVVEYLKSPPSKETMKKILKMLDCDPRSLMRKGESEYKELSLNDENLSDDNLIEAILNESTTLELLKIAKEKDNFVTMQQVGRMFLQQGDISLEEYKRVLIIDQ